MNKVNTGKKRFLRDAHNYILTNGPSTAEELHEALRFTKTGKLLRDSPTRQQVQQILRRSELFVHHTTEVGYSDPSRYTTYPVNCYSIRGDE